MRENKSKPFFLYLAFTIPHFSLEVPEDSLAEYRGKFPEPHPYHDGHYTDQPEPRAAYAGMITRMDRDVGRIISLIKPHYEVAEHDLVHGVLSPDAAHQAVKRLRGTMANLGLEVAGEIMSPVKGQGGNTEFLWLLRPGSRT